MSRSMGRNRDDLETGLTELIPHTRTLASYLIFIVALVFTISNWQLLFGNLPIWMLVGLLLLAAYIIGNANCHLGLPGDEAETRARIVDEDGLIEDEEEQVHAPQTQIREGLPELRIRIAQTKREFDDLDYEDLRALDEDTALDAPITNDGKNNDRYMVQSHIHVQKTLKIDLCVVCQEHFIVGELLRDLPCLHQFHKQCVDPWLREHGTCPLCKYRIMRIIRR